MGGSYTRMERYLAALPEGVDSYPQCRMKAALVNITKKKTPFAAGPDMPPWLVTFIETHYAMTEWVPLVACNAWVLAMVDSIFEGRLDRYLTFNYNQNKEYASNPMFALLYKIMSPSFLMRHTPTAFKQMIQGVGVTVGAAEPGSARLHMSYPRNLYEDTLALGWTAAFRASLEATGAMDPKVELAAFTPTSAEFRATWTVT